MGEEWYLLLLNSIILRHMKNFLTCENIFDMMFSLKILSKNKQTEKTTVRHFLPKIPRLSNLAHEDVHVLGWGHLEPASTHHPAP